MAMTEARQMHGHDARYMPMTHLAYLRRQAAAVRVNAQRRRRRATFIELEWAALEGRRKRFIDVKAVEMRRRSRASILYRYPTQS